MAPNLEVPGLWRNLVLALAGLLFWTVPALAADAAYDVKITGMPEGEPLSLFNGTSDLILLKDNSPPSAPALAGRFDGDMEKARQILAAFGYFDARVTGSADTGATPPHVEIDVVPGERYDFASPVIKTADGAALGPVLSPPPDQMKVVAKRRYLAQDVIDSEAAIIAQLGRKAHPFAAIVQRDAAADTATRTVTVTWTVDPGPAARFGPVGFEGLGRLKEHAARRLITWSQGKPVDMDEVERTRRSIVQTGLFNTVTVTLGRPDADGLAPVSIKLTERAPRTVTLGARYSTGEGFGLGAGWEHRNLFGHREDLKVDADAAQTGYALSAQLTKPDFGWRNVDLLTQLEAKDEDLPAYDAKHLFAGAGLTWHVGAGVDEPPLVDLSATVVGQQERFNRDDGEGTKNVTLIGLRLGAARDTTNDLLEPTHGYRVNLSVAPYKGFGDGGDFVQSRLTGAYYLPLLDDERKLVFATRASLGSIVGAGHDSMPPDYLFYAGGGDSIRGFKFQYAGPMDGHTPLGGRSLATATAELRWYVTDDIGIVPFFDVGSVYPTSYPDFSGSVFGGAGVGLRYRSPVGPLRLDVATPVMGKRGFDNVVQVYISIGQAF